MDDKEEAMELVEWAERKLQEATERIEQLEMQLSALQAGREQAVQAPPGLDGAFKRALGTMKAAQQRHLDSSKAASAAAQVLRGGRRWRRRRGPTCAVRRACCKLRERSSSRTATTSPPMLAEHVGCRPPRRARRAPAPPFSAAGSTYGGSTLAPLCQR